MRSATVSLRAGKWHVSILAAREVEQPVPTATSAVGINVGVARFGTLSDGTYIAPLASFKKHEQRLAKHQRSMARKVKGSTNRKKAKERIQRIHARIANARTDFLHKVSNTISKNHAMIAVENLQVRNMSQSAKGTADAPSVLSRDLTSPFWIRASWLERVSSPAGVQERVARMLPSRSSAEEHESNLPVLRTYFSREPQDAAAIRLH